MVEGDRLRNCRSLSEQSPKLNLGCGRLTLPGFVNIDHQEGDGVDMVLDIEHDRFPFENGTVNAILGSHVFEHLSHLERVLAECARVLRPGGLLEVYVPFGRYGFTKTPQHVRAFWPRGIRNLVVQKRSLEKQHEPPSPWAEIALIETSRYSLPMAWHVREYLHLSPNFGLPSELHFVLVKERESDDDGAEERGRARGECPH